MGTQTHTTHQSVFIVNNMMSIPHIRRTGFVVFVAVLVLFRVDVSVGLMMVTKQKKNPISKRSCTDGDHAGVNLSTVDTRLSTSDSSSMDRRRWIQSSFGATTAVLLPITLPQSAIAAATAGEPTDVEEALMEAKKTLQTLLDNWSNAVIDCTYADVPRELLAAENKELLLEKAKTSALFDKSASVVSCKTINTKVRDYLGITGKGPVSVLPKVLKGGLTQIMDMDGDVDLDLYVQTTEQVQQALFKADSLSYEARRDFTSMNNFDESQSEKVLADPNSNLSQAKQAIMAAIDGIDQLLKLLRPQKTI